MASAASGSEPAAKRGKTARRIAVMGGAFDPPTVGHILVGTEVVHNGLADELLLVPSGHRPDKLGQSGGLHRLSMCNLAVSTCVPGGFPISVSDIEIIDATTGRLRDQGLRTFDLLTVLQQKYPDADISFVVGSDWLRPGMDIRGTWYRGADLVDKFSFLVLRRPGYTGHGVTDLKAYGPNFRWVEARDGLDLCSAEISSSEVRKRMKQHGYGTAAGLVPPAVLAYCESKVIPGGQAVRRNTSPHIYFVMMLGCTQHSRLVAACNGVTMRKCIAFGNLYMVTLVPSPFAPTLPVRSNPTGLFIIGGGASQP